MNDRYHLIDSQGALSSFVGTLSAAVDKQRESQGTARLYLDTEFESNRSGTKLCLLQISAGNDAYLLDVLRLRSLEPLANTFSQCDWVLHAGLQDVQLMGHALGTSPKRLFDTQIAWALSSPETGVSLSYLKYRLLGERGDKAHQADDWVRRPLQPSQLKYAAADVHHLPEMTQLLLSKLERLERTEIAFAASLDTLQPRKEPPAPLSLGSFRNAWQLSPRSQAVLVGFMRWFNALSPQQRRHAPENKVLLSIASRCPRNHGELARIKGVSRGALERFGGELLAVIAHAEAEASAENFVALDPPPYETYEDIRLDAWLAQMRAELSVTLEFAPELVLPKRLLSRMKATLQIEGLSGFLDSLSGWQRDLLLPSLESFCEQSPPPV